MVVGVGVHHGKKPLFAADERLAMLKREIGDRAGADAARVEIRRDLQLATVEGQRTFISARVTATATGRPRIAA